MKCGVILLGLFWAGAHAGCRPVSLPMDDVPHAGATGTGERTSDDAFPAPVALCSLDGSDEILLLESIGGQAIVLDGAARHMRRTIPLPGPVGGAAVRGTTAYITTLEPAGRVLAVDLESGKISKEVRAGHTPMSPVLSPDGRTLYVANRFDNTVSLIDLTTGSSRAVEVVREPVAMALGAGGRRLFVANHLPQSKLSLDDENPFIAAEVSVIDTEQARLLCNIELPNGSQGLRGIALSTDGRQVVVTHVLSRYFVPAMQIENGAMNGNAFSVLDAETLEWIETVMLDDPNDGAANPWAAAFSSDGQRLLITHAGTHELSVIDYPALRDRVAAKQASTGRHSQADPITLAGIRRRIPLGINGARAILEKDGIAYVPGFFSDDLAMIDMRSAEPAVRIIALRESAIVSPARLGEQYFNDATLCRQRWQSCATCHPDGSSDTLYWDLLNDGMGNTKDTKSLLMAALTPPAMWRGVRADAATAVRAGMHHILFAEPRPDAAEAIDTYLLHMKAVPGPGLIAGTLEEPKTEGADCAKCHLPGVPRGVLPAAARRGKALFEGKAGCATCHPHPAFTSMQKVDPGLGSGIPYDVPSLVEVWRTAPYLHSSEALTLRETITDFNFMQKRGRTKDLTEQELDDLLEYLRCL